MPQSGRSVELIEPFCGESVGERRAMNHRWPVACRRARENRLSCSRAFSQFEPGRLTELATTGCWETADDPGDVAGAVALGVADLVLGPAECARVPVSG